MPCPRCGNDVDFALHRLCPDCECDAEEERTIDEVAALRARVAELERDLDRERESNKRLARKILKLTEVKRSR